jgi:hypothetical protein
MKDYDGDLAKISVNISFVNIICLAKSEETI